MLIIPAIDLRGGRVVRLAQGDYARQTTYARDPVATATRFAAQGAQRVHVVDLDAARGLPDEESRIAMAAIVAALRRLDAQTEVGGGMRSEATAREWIERGADLVVIGSLALRDPAAAQAICESLPGRILLGLDVRDGQAQAQGWTQPGGAAEAHVQRWREWPAAGIIHTNTERDGMMSGPDVDALRALRHAYPGPVYASGGVSDLDDLAACAACGVAGVVIGRAVYEAGLDVAEAVRRFGVAVAS